MAVIGAVSIENGVDCYSIYPNSVDKWKYLEFLQKLQRRRRNAKLCCVVDNCRVHHSKIIKNWIREQNGSIVQLHVPPYSPWLNSPIENLWSFVKLPYKQELSKRVITGQSPDVKKLISV